ncbi:hypothetical protein CLI92_09035 [Vandammella animalimorsus]|uniref:Tip attachment protein J central straight fiber domain-containing protein n=1 Tax=Vandammella animalimorsus TaxID=2029117 RepID=A0A2A2T4U3_9BURK|nr:DUF1983 domain-containing protein [Vandammella animalimorsus]PAT31886.1 hypothetical protein CK626_07770 [Vandammella animalimorsus]PAX16467.1 hypothetical protein CLI92_09035 [Vandammella animalimorsus]PAX18882.1 hypothetical protein CLI93_11115 [Vandammella animalimorsus]
MSGQWLSRPKGRQAQLPGLPAVPRAVDAEVGNWMRKVAERLEVREGQRGDPKERAVTVREFERANVASHYLSMEKKPGPGEIGLELGGGLTATIHIEKFIDAIRGLPLFKDLLKSLDDPSRFDHLPGQIRQIVLQDIAEEARKRGADIRRVELVQRERFSQLAAVVQELTAAVGDSAAGLRELSYAYADGNSAMAGKITQLQASLGRFYLDGTPGRVALEQEMRVQADRITGLRGQYTLKVQAGKAIAGFGLAASDNGTGGLSSAFIVAAEKFAIVNPATYTGGLTTTPAQAHIPFGVDSHGIYLNHNVYIRGNVRIDTGGKRLIDGLRGSVDVYRNGVWSDAAASAAVWQALGKTGSPSNSNHLVIGDTVTFTHGSTVTTKAWMGSSWRNPGMVLNGNLLVNGSVAASKIDTRGLTIKDNAGRVILDAGSVNFNLINHIAGLTADKVTGLGAMARKHYASIGETVRFSDGTVMGEQDFVSRLRNKITAGNINTFMEGAAITNAYIGYAAVDTLKIAGNAVTVPIHKRSDLVMGGSGFGNWMDYTSAHIHLDQPGAVLIMVVAHIGTDGHGWRVAGSRLLVNGQIVSERAIDTGYYLGVHYWRHYMPSPGTVEVKVQFMGGDPGIRIAPCDIVLLGVKR